jgi:hypothetical protein
MQLAEPRNLVDPNSTFYWHWYESEGLATASPRSHPEIIYSADFFSGDAQAQLSDCRLVMHDADLEKPLAGGSAINLWVESNDQPGWPRIQIWGDRLYVIGDHLATLDITNPIAPRLISCVPFVLHPLAGQPATVFSVRLPRIPGLPKEERLKAAVQTWNWWYFPDEGVLCEDGRAYGSETNAKIIAWRVVKLTDDAATFEPIGESDETFLEQLFGSFWVRTVAVRDGPALSPCVARNIRQPACYRLQSPQPASAPANRPFRRSGHLDCLPPPRRPRVDRRQPTLARRPTTQSPLSSLIRSARGA